MQSFQVDICWIRQEILHLLPNFYWFLRGKLGNIIFQNIVRSDFLLESVIVL
jgi:hypothetical protein